VRHPRRRRLPARRPVSPASAACPPETGALRYHRLLDILVVTCGEQFKFLNDIDNLNTSQVKGIPA